MSVLAGSGRSIVDDLARRTPVARDLPYYFQIHLNEPCNQRCIMCRPPGQTRGGVLPLEDFVALFDRLREHAEHLTLIGGEPFMYPWMPEILDLARVIRSR